MSHRCHANGCTADDCHPELPFCKRHFQMLPEPYRKKLWGWRRRDGVCGACDHREAEEVRLRAADGWQELFNQSIAILLVLEYGDCGSHPHLFDKGGFCWGCGVFDAEETYRNARSVILQFNLGKNVYAD